MKIENLRNKVKGKHDASHQIVIFVTSLYACSRLMMFDTIKLIILVILKKILEIIISFLLCVVEIIN